MPGASVQSQTALQVYSITDFTAGIVSSTNAPKTTPRVPNSQANTTFSTNTYGCYGLPSGGLLLGPTPILVDTPTLSNPTGMTDRYVAGVVRQDGFGPSGDYVYLLVTEGANSSSGDVMTAVYAVETSTNTFLIDFTLADAFSVITPAYPFLTTLTDGTLYYYMLVYTAFSAGAPNATAYYVAVNSITSATGGAMGASDWGFAIPANGRVWFFVPQLTDQLILNAINYTGSTIPTSGDNRTFPAAQNTLVDYDDPSSFGAWGAISSSNSLLVKSSNGGIIVTGDIYDPTISRAPAVQGTHGLIGSSCLTPLGLVYRSYNRGVWVWDGGAASTKLSQNLNDFEFDQSSNNYFGGIQYFSQPYQNLPNSIYNVQYICSMIFTDGGLFFDPVTSAWWKLPPYTSSTVSDTPPLYYMESGPSFGSFYTAAFVAGTYTQVYYSFDPSEPTSHVAHYDFTPPSGFYSSFLETNPINVSSDNIVNVEEVSLVIQGIGELTINILGIDGAVLTSKSISVSNTSFKRIDITTAFETDVIILQIGWTNSTTTGTTPIISSIELQYRDRFPVLNQ